MSETMLLGGLLAVVGGYLDAYTYLARGQVFANAQTGNMVLLGLHLSQGHFDRVLYYSIPILAFALGVIVAEGIKERFQDSQTLHWRQIIVGVETLTLAAVGLLPLGKADLAANTLISFVCSVQVESFRKVRGNPFATTMCTGNLRSGMELLYRAIRTGNGALWAKSLHYFGVILSFILGAILGTFLTRRWGQYGVLFCCATLTVAFAVMFLPEDKDP